MLMHEKTCSIPIIKHIEIGSNVSSVGQRKLGLDYLDAQARLSLRSAHMSEDTFSHVASHLINS